MNAAEPRPPYPQFDLRERNAPSADVRAEGARSSLRAVWSVPTDTFVTGDLPLLLTMMSDLAPAGAAAEARTGGAAEARTSGPAPNGVAAAGDRR